MSLNHPDSFGARDTLEVGGRTLEIFRLDALQERFDVARLPFSLKILLENLLRTEDGQAVTARGHRGARGLGPRRAGDDRDRVHAEPGADAGLHRRAGDRRPGRDARRDGGSWAATRG